MAEDAHFSFQENVARIEGFFSPMNFFLENDKQQILSWNDVLQETEMLFSV